MTSNIFHTDNNHLKPKRSKNTGEIKSQDIFTIDDEESMAEDSSYMKAQESRRILREMVDGRKGTAPKIPNGEEISQDYSSTKNEEVESGSDTRMWIRILVIVMLFSYISTMLTWVSRMTMEKKYASDDAYSIDMSDTCSLSRLKAGDGKECNDICDPYKCCWDMDYREEEESCYEKYETAFCAQFLPCRNMLVSFDDSSLNNQEDAN